MAEATETTETTEQMTEPEPLERQTVEAADKPEAAPEQRQAIEFTPPPLTADDVESEFDKALAALDADEMLSPGDRAARRAGLLADKARHRDGREEKQRREFDRQQSSEDRARQNEATRYGVDRSVVDSTWDEAAAETRRELGRPSQDATMMLYRQKMKANAAAANNTQTDEPVKQPTRQVGSTRSIPRQARQAPAPAAKKMTVQEMIDQGKLPDDLEKQLAAELA